jgi:hypothetical protein
VSPFAVPSEKWPPTVNQIDGWDMEFPLSTPEI